MSGPGWSGLSLERGAQRGVQPDEGSGSGGAAAGESEATSKRGRGGSKRGGGGSKRGGARSKRSQRKRDEAESPRADVCAEEKEQEEQGQEQLQGHLDGVDRIAMSGPGGSGLSLERGAQRGVQPDEGSGSGGAAAGESEATSKRGRGGSKRGGGGSKRGGARSKRSQRKRDEAESPRADVCAEDKEQEEQGQEQLQGHLDGVDREKAEDKAEDDNTRSKIAMSGPGGPGLGSERGAQREVQPDEGSGSGGAAAGETQATSKRGRGGSKRGGGCSKRGCARSKRSQCKRDEAESARADVCAEEKEQEEQGQEQWQEQWQEGADRDEVEDKAVEGWAKHPPARLQALQSSGRSVSKALARHVLALPADEWRGVKACLLELPAPFRAPAVLHVADMIRAGLATEEEQRRWAAIKARIASLRAPAKDVVRCAFALSEPEWSVLEAMGPACLLRAAVATRTTDVGFLEFITALPAPLRPALCDLVSCGADHNEIIGKIKRALT
jgi:hypothetical protein